MEQKAANFLLLLSDFCCGFTHPQDRDQDAVRDRSDSPNTGWTIKAKLPNS
jgi:hypothetical protein